MTSHGGENLLGEIIRMSHLLQKNLTNKDDPLIDNCDPLTHIEPFI